MNASDKVSKARATLVLDNPFFGSLALRVEPKEVDFIETMATDGISVVYNEKYVDTLTLKQTIGVMAHEVLHIATEHHLRRKDRNPEKWNVACDYAINDVLIEDGFELPDTDCKNWGADEPAEEIYQKLKDPPSSSGGGSGGIGDVMDMPGSGPGGQATQAEKDQASAELKIALAQAAQTARSCGKLSANMERLVGEVLEPKLDWKEILRQFIDRNAKNDYAWYPPNRKYVYLGLYLPSVRSETIGKIAVIVDTSGSIGSREIDEFAGEISGILESHRGSAKVIYCDADVDSAEDFEFDDLPLELHPTGGGGTDFRPGFKYIDENMMTPPPCAVYLTDGWCNDFPAPPPYPVMWVCTEDHFEPPFGDVLFLNDRE